MLSLKVLLVYSEIVSSIANTYSSIYHTLMVSITVKE